MEEQLPPRFGESPAFRFPATIRRRRHQPLRVPPALGQARTVPDRPRHCRVHGPLRAVAAPARHRRRRHLTVTPAAVELPSTGLAGVVAEAAAGDIEVRSSAATSAAASSRASGCVTGSLGEYADGAEGARDGRLSRGTKPPGPGTASLKRTPLERTRLEGTRPEGTRPEGTVAAPGARTPPFMGWGVVPPPSTTDLAAEH